MVQACCRGEEFSIDVFCDLEARCLNAVPRTMIESKGGESIKGMTIRDAELIEVGRARLGDARARRAGEHPVLPRAGRHAPRHRHQSALRRRLPAADGGREPLSGAGARARRRGAAGADGSGDFRDGLVMTRFFSELVLSAGDGRYLGAVRGGAPRAGASTTVGVLLLALAGSGSPPHAAGTHDAAARRRRTAPFSLHRTLAAPVAARPARAARRHVIDGDRWRRACPARVVQLWGRQRPHRPARRRRDPRAVAAPLQRDRRRARLRRRARVSRTSRDAPQGDRARLPARAPVAAVRRDGDADAGADAHPAAPAVPHRVERSALGGLIEFPAVVDDGVAYIGNARATIHAISMRSGTVIWRHDTPHGKMASSPAVVGERARLPHDGRPRVRARPRDGPAAAGSYDVGSPIESSPIVGDGDRLLRRLERAALRTRPAHAPAALDALARREDHVERRDRRRARSTSATTAGGSGRSSPRTGATRWVALGERPDLRHACGRWTAACSCRRRPAAR